jgi:hypothetical protein
MSPNFLHSRFPRLETHIDSLHSQGLPSSCRQTYVHQILFSNKNKKVALSVGCRINDLPML